jgi:hypothetical protein
VSIVPLADPAPAGVGAPPGLRVAPRPHGRPVASTLTGARFHPLLPFETWMGLGAKIGTYSNATAWWLGDWLLYGRMKYGRRYKAAIEVTGLDYQTLRNYAVVARRFDPSRRRSDLSFQHHAEICAMADAEQDRWLAAASTGRWSRNELRRRIRASRTEESPPRVLRLVVGPEQLECWREAAGCTDRGLEDWVLRSLDDAATRTVGAAHLTVAVR